jgi:hypothetical protein
MERGKRFHGEKAEKNDPGNLPQLHQIDKLDIYRDLTSGNPYIQSVMFSFSFLKVSGNHHSKIGKNENGLPQILSILDPNK